MDYRQALKKIEKLERRPWNIGLGPVSELLDKLGNPQNELKCIHVAGTNAKGSVCAMLNSILIDAGYKAGMYISPHLVDMRERITINNKKIPKKDLIGYYKKIKKHHTNQSFFEFFTAIAFLYFKEKNVDFVVLEVGMGGRLDATNVVKPLVSVITNISMEHKAHLGHNIKKIAFEKAGIIKQNVPVVTAAEGKALEIIKNISKDKGSRLFIVKKPVENFELALIGDFQKKNAAIVLKTVDVLNKEYNPKISKKNIKDGLRKAKWPGRLQFIKKNVLIDGAHNPGGILNLKKELSIIKKQRNFKKIILIIGILKDKDYKTILKIITPVTKNIILTKPKSDRAAEPSLLYRYIPNKRNKIIKKIKNLGQAVKYARKIAGKDDLILVCGSLYLIGEVLS